MSSTAQRQQPATSEVFRLDGRVAVISGASRGIGEAVARLFASRGADVIVSSRRQKSCEAVASAIRERGGRPCHAGEPAQRQALIQGVVADKGRLDILVNNAATNPYFGHILDTSDWAFDKTTSVEHKLLNRGLAAVEPKLTRASGSKTGLTNALLGKI